MITEEQIWSYLDGQLNEASRKEVEFAVSNNKQAAALFEEISALQQSLKGETLLLSPSAEFTDRVMAAVQITPAYITQVKFPFKLFLLFAAPVLCVIVVFAVLLAHYHLPLTYSLPMHIAMPNFKSFQLYFVVADVVILAYLLDFLSEYRFNRKTLFA